ncbi:Anaphase-promoting complex subunit 7 [Chytriomyces hyalinus]|nr:Anaphase-promoting complex subunit 7 [Chytriomyces hyalinus]
MDLTQRARQLLHAGMSESAHNLCLASIGQIKSGGRNSKAMAEALSVVAESIAAKEPQRSLAVFEQALAMDPHSLSIRTAFASSCISARKPARAITLLEQTVKQHPQSLRLLNLLADAYSAASNTTAPANTSSKLQSTLLQILHLEPLATEVMKKLISLKYPVQNIMRLVPADCCGWVEPLLLAHQASLNCNFKDANAKLTILAQKLGREDTDILLEIADCHLNDGNYILAHYLFEKVRQQDPYIIKRMDRYARVLQSKGSAMQLNRLATHLISLTEDRPEPWVVMARYSETKGDFERAIQLVDKALTLDKRHGESYLLKGSLMLSLHRPQEAISCFVYAHQLAPSLESYRGLLESYLACRRSTEALAVAKEAAERMPGNARALALIGCAYSHMPDRHVQAKALFTKALKLDPKCTEALFALVSSLVAESNLSAASDLLVRSLIHVNTPVVHTRLGDVYTLMKRYDLAMEHFHVALKMESGCDAAKRGLEAVEKLIEGANGGAKESHGRGGSDIEADESMEEEG